MASQKSKILALYIAGFVLFASVTVVITFSGTASAYTKSSGNVSVGNSEMVNVSDATIDPSNRSRIPVAVNVSGTGLQPSEIRLRAVNTLSPNNKVVNTTLLSEADFPSNASTGNITLVTSPITGPTPSFTLNVTAYDANTGAAIPGATNESTITIDDTTAPTISNVTLTNDGYDKFRLSFDSTETLGHHAGNLSVTVTGPNGATYTFDRGDFFTADSRANFTYQLHVLQSFDDGGGTYTASVDTAEDHFGNDGGVGAPTSDYEYTTDFSDTTVENRPTGPNLDTSNVTMFTTKIQDQFLFVQLENDTANFGRRDISGEGATEESGLWVNFTVANFNPDVMMGTAKVDRWSYTMNDDGSASVNISLQPASTERNFTAWQNGVQRPADWGPEYDGSDRSMDAVVDVGLANLSAVGEPDSLDGARLTTDAQAADVPRLDANGNLTIDVASPHCVAETAAPANECSGDEINDGGFYEAVIPSAFYQQEWNVSELSSGDVAVAYTSSSSTSTETTWNVSVRDDGALVLNGTDIHYSDGTVEISQVESDDSGDDGGEDDGGSSGGTSGSGTGGTATTEFSTERTDGGTVATITRVSIDDLTVTVPVDGVTADAFAVTEVTATFDQGTNVENTISVSAHETPGAQIPTPPGDGPFRYVSVTVDGNLADRVAAGSFRLDLVGDAVDPAAVTAHRYHDGEWQTVETIVIDESTIEVSTPGYSLFAIGLGGSTQAVTDAPAMTPTETTTPPETTAVPTTTPTTDRKRAATPTATATDGMPGFGLGVGLLGLLVGMILATRRTP